MRALVCKAWGSPAESLEIQTLPDPAPAWGQVVVRMMASPVNPSDLLTIQNKYGRQPSLPFVPGFEGVGRVLSGKGPLAWRVMGRRVAVIAADGGAWAEQCLIPAIRAIPIPDSIPDDQAASFFVNPATAWAIARNVLRLGPRDLVVQSAAAGAVGQMIQGLSKYLGFGVIHVVRRNEQAESLLKLGARDIVVGEGEHLARQIKDLIGSRTCQYGLDAIGGETGAAILKSLSRHGVLISYGRLSGQPIPVEPGTLMDGMKRIQGFWLSEWMKDQNKLTLWRLFGRLAKLIDAGIIKTPTGPSYPINQFAEAMNQSASAGKSGKVLLRFD
ncbi:MAG: zinc-dependent alcohol dehydrogenase family protein [Planctomycetes bacterium]|nr:zinc-dependent alcohol dehydrogenase family protein [Planctomycetota bacterium]